MQADLDQEQLGAELGISRKTVMRYEMGETSPSVILVARWAAVCDAFPEWIAFGTEPAEAVIDTRDQATLPTGRYVDRRPALFADRVKYAPVVAIGSRRRVA